VGAAYWTESSSNCKKVTVLDLTEAVANRAVSVTSASMPKEHENKHASDSRP
jgi:hypothetical protein